MKNLTTLFSFIFLLLFGLESLGLNTEISGPTTMCPGSEKFYDANSTSSGASWTWSCSNCEVLDPADDVWKSSYTHYAWEAWYIVISRGKTNVRFSTSGSSATIYYSVTGSHPGSDSRTVYLTAPSSSPGSITGLSYLQNCNSTQNTYTLNPANSWEYDWWSTSSGLTTISSSSSNIKVQATSTSATSTEFVKAKMKWRDPSGAICHTKYITKSITLTGSPSSNNIQLLVVGGIGNNTVCSSDDDEDSFIRASYNNTVGFMDSWEWDLPSNWITEGSGNHVAVISAESGGNVRVRAYNECGWTGWKTQYVSVEECAGGLLFLSPNPATDQITLEERPNGDVAIRTKNEKDYEVEFYKSTELITIRPKVKVGDKINTSRLTNGIYIVHIIAPNESIVKTRLIVDK